MLVQVGTGTLSLGHPCISASPPLPPCNSPSCAFLPLRVKPCICYHVTSVSHAANLAFSYPDLRYVLDSSLEQSVVRCCLTAAYSMIATDMCYCEWCLWRQPSKPCAVPRPCHAMLCCAVLCCAVLCCAVLCCTVLCCAVLCCAVLCCPMLSPC